ncbi:uncharacterized protein TNCV_440201 [Trichonephila clavipes]|nr:uncharacterized protein TNCV_440201 [Trichonephila clavipes]
MDEILITTRDLELEENEDDIEELIMEHEDELTTEELQEILNEEHQETPQNVSPSEQEEDERRPMPTSAIQDLLKKWVDVRAMVLEWHPNQADVSRNEANPQVYVETPLHPEKLTVWCALWAGGIIGPYFFKNDEGHNVIVNGDRYRAMITNFSIPELNNHDVQELWFQQDGATCHTARATIDLLKDTFGDRLISLFGPVNWPPRSCDLTPLDYFLWSYVKVIGLCG